MAVPSTPCNFNINTLCVDGWEDVPISLQETATQYATMVLWAATGRRYGLCEITVRPCGRTCQNCPQGYQYDGYGGTWMPYIWNGVWRNCWCGGEVCTCEPACQVYLPGPVDSIVEVRVGGESLPASGGAYFVLDQQFLVRVDTAECWPECSDQSLAPGDTEAFEVTYLRGNQVPAILQTAAGTLAGEYVKACQGQPCRLPGRVTNIARSGVSVNMVDVDTLLASGLTGILEVDQVIIALNPYRLKGRTRFYSPELEIARQVTWP